MRGSCGSEMKAPVSLLVETLRAGSPQPQKGDHIVLLIDQFPRVLGGGERVVLRTARLLQDAGYRISIVTFQVFCDASVLEAARCPVYLLPLENVFSSTALRAAWQFGRFLRKENVCIVMTFFESSNLFGGLATKAFSRARLIWNRRDMGILREEKHKAAYRLLPWLPDHVIAVSEEVRRHAIEVDRIPQERVSVVYNGLENTGAPARDEWPSTPIVVTVGNIRPVKGHDTLVEAAAIVLRRHPETSFRIIGEMLDAEFFAELQRRVAELGLGDCVTFLGGIPDPGPLLREASVFVLPSRSEGFSNAIVEAMLAGLPVVATRVGGNAEAVVDEETGFLISPDRPEALATALCTMLENPASMRSMGDAGRQRAERHFSSSGMIHKLMGIFDGVKS